MKKSVTLTALMGVIFTQLRNQDGSPKLDQKGREHGYIRVENPAKVSLGFAYNGDNIRNGDSALIGMTVEAWEKNKKYYTEGKTFEGNVRIVESLKGGKGFQPKMAGSKENAIPCTLGGKQIYRRTEFDATGLLEDVLIQHDNTAAISALAKSSAAASVTAINA
jgi:hypothetical protein